MKYLSIPIDSMITHRINDNLKNSHHEDEPKALIDTLLEDINI
jgi:hypothetical protein